MPGWIIHTKINNMQQILISCWLIFKVYWPTNCLLDCPWQPISNIFMTLSLKAAFHLTWWIISSQFKFVISMVMYSRPVISAKLTSTRPDLKLSYCCLLLFCVSMIITSHFCSNLYGIFMVESILNPNHGDHFSTGVSPRSVSFAYLKELPSALTSTRSPLMVPASAQNQQDGCCSLFPITVLWAGKEKWGGGPTAGGITLREQREKWVA